MINIVPFISIALDLRCVEDITIERSCAGDWRQLFEGFNPPPLRNRDLLITTAFCTT